MQINSYVNEIDTQYAKALLELCIENKQNPKQILDILQTLASAFEDNKDIYKVLTHPNITILEKHQIIDNIVEEKLVKNFLFVLLDNKRFNELSLICIAMKQMIDDKDNVKKIEIVTRYELTSKQKQEIVTKLSEHYHKVIDATFSIDKGFIGGIVIKTRDEVIDQTLLHNMLNLKDELKGEVR